MKQAVQMHYSFLQSHLVSPSRLHARQPRCKADDMYKVCGIMVLDIAADLTQICKAGCVDEVQVSCDSANDVNSSARRTCVTAKWHLC